jgi:MYXO-CTERM domain-containing protein
MSDAGAADAGSDVSSDLRKDAYPRDAYGDGRPNADAGDSGTDVAVRDATTVEVQGMAKPDLGAQQAPDAMSQQLEKQEEPSGVIIQGGGKSIGCGCQVVGHDSTPATVAIILAMMVAIGLTLGRRGRRSRPGR